VAALARPSALARRSGLLDPVAAQVETTLFRALAVLRFVVAIYAVVLNALRWREFEHPVAGWVVVGVIVVWTGFAAWAYDDPRRRGLPLLVADFLVAAATLLSTRYVQSDAMLDRHASTMPSFWVMVAVLAWAVALGWPAGLGAAVVMSLLDLSVHTEPTGTTWGNIFLLLLAAGVVGYSADLVREATEARAEAERVAAVVTERARLARAVHDGVLQVLALMQRRGVELGGEAADLGRLAAEQEAALRSLVQGNAAVAALGGPGRRTAPAEGDDADLVAALAALASATVTVTSSAGAVTLPAPVVSEVTSVVRACLDNVSRHVGPHAPAWVLVEADDDEVVVSVRDDGPGIAPGRLEEAVTEGRLGVSESIRGRMADLGGTAGLVTAPGGGTEWELVLHTAPGGRTG
jgi:signal transduction histidine kinase